MVPTLKSYISPYLQNVLENHSKLFETPKGLPRICDHDHVIHLIPGFLPPNIEPYRYSYAQTSEIEHMVVEMVEVGIIIQPNLINKVRDEWNNGEVGWELIQKFPKVSVPTVLPKLDKEGKIILEPGAVTKTRTQHLQNRSISEYLIKWKNLPVECSTWEDKNFI